MAKSSKQANNNRFNKTHLNKSHSSKKSSHKNRLTGRQSMSQVRIVGGQYKRRTVSFIDAGGLRPTPDRVRETLFNWLMHEVNGANVLDACAGSGVLGFEAVSRGASHVTFIEANAKQITQLEQSRETLKISKDNFTLFHGKAEEVLAELKPSAPFDLVFLDPPYALDLWITLLQALITQALIHTETLIYLEADKPFADIFADSAFENKLHWIKDKKMGQVYCGLVQINTSI